MSDPAMPPLDQATGARFNKVFLAAAASDVVIGLVLAALGLQMDEPVLMIIGVAVAISGTAVTAWLIVRTSRPQQL